MKIVLLRRYVLLAVMLLFFSQFFKVKALVGGLSGSLAVWSITLIDVFACFEILIASRDFTQQAFFSVTPLIGIYLIFGRAFCGWVCPMDFLFELINKARNWQKMRLAIPPLAGYIIVFLFLAISFFVEMPVFTNYISHLTNFFRMLTGGVFISLKLPADTTVFYFSGGAIFLLLVLEFFFPRLWCRVLCPLGKTYGLFNKVSLLKLRIKSEKCVRCNACEQVCYMDVRIFSTNKSVLRDTSCIYCGRCSESCGEGIIKMSLR